MYATESAVAIAPTVGTPPIHSIGSAKKRASSVKTTRIADDTKNPAPAAARTAQSADERANAARDAARELKDLRELASQSAQHRARILAV